LRGLFLTVEGVDGSGKTTQAARLAADLRTRGVTVVETREPGGSAGAEAIRALLLTGADGRWSAQTELLLFTAARRDHVERVIRPALEAGAVVICDRYVDSTRAYQGLGDAGLAGAVDTLHALMIGLDPDATLVFDLPAEERAARTAARAAPEDRFERRGAAFQDALAEAFRALVRADPQRMHRIDAGGTPEEVAARVRAVVEPLLAPMLDPSGEAREGLWEDTAGPRWPGP
jgi:dTMP kinase